MRARVERTENEKAHKIEGKAWNEKRRNMYIERKRKRGVDEGERSGERFQGFSTEERAFANKTRL